jgi:hypothetical protein
MYMSVGCRKIMTRKIKVVFGSALCDDPEKRCSKCNVAMRIVFTDSSEVVGWCCPVCAKTIKK